MNNNIEPINGFVYGVGVMVGVYLLEERLGGNQQLIFRGVDSRNQKTVVLKIFVNSLDNDLDHKAYYNEIWARDLAKFTPGILKIIDRGVHNRSEYFVTEFVEAGNLSRVVKQHVDISLQEIVLLFTPIAEALDELHRLGVIHRDIKPENILARNVNGKWEIFIIDFGDARFSQEPDGTYVTNSIAGTAQYIAPEVFTITPTSVLVDNYSFGVMLYTVFEGKPPFNKSRIPIQDVDLGNEPLPYPEKTQQRHTKGVADIVLWAMSDSPNQRPKTTMEIIDLLKKIEHTRDENDKKWIGRRFKNYVALDILYKGRISPSVLALDLMSGEKVVLKTFVKDSLQGDAKELYENELKSLNKLEGEHHIMFPKDTFEQDGVFFIVNSYLDGGSLRDFLKTEPELEILLDILIQVADAIDHIHKKGLVHRDIKPENIVYHVSGGKYQAYLTDFGITKILDNTVAISFTTKYQRGTGPYMAPETWHKEARKTKAIDIYAFGIMLYEIFEGRLPFAEKNPDFLPYQHINEPVPPFKETLILNNPKVGEIILKMLNKNPKARPKFALPEVKKLKRLLTQPRKQKASELSTDPDKVMAKEEYLDEPKKELPNEPRIEPSKEPKDSKKKSIFWLSFVLGAIVIVCIWLSISYIPWTPTLTPTLTITFTPTSFKTFDAVVSQPGFCHNGPNESYLGAKDIASGTRVEVLATNSDGKDWFMIRGVGIDPCWIRSGTLTLPPTFDLDEVLVFTTVTTTGDTLCRVFPDEERELQTIIPPFRRLVAYGKSDPSAIWVLVVPHDSTELCWIKRDALTSFQYDSLIIESAGPIPNLNDTFTHTPMIVSTTEIAAATSTNRPTSIPVIPTKTRERGGNDNPTATPGSNNLATNTLVPPPTNTPVPPPTNTPVPPPTNTPVPPPTNTPEPIATATLCWPPGKCK